MTSSDVAAWAVLGPIIIMWWAWMMRMTFNLIRYNNILGDR